MTSRRARSLVTSCLTVSRPRTRRRRHGVHRQPLRIGRPRRGRGLRAPSRARHPPLPAGASATDGSDGLVTTPPGRTHSPVPSFAAARSKSGTSKACDLNQPRRRARSTATAAHTTAADLVALDARERAIPRDIERRLPDGCWPPAIDAIRPRLTGMLTDSRPRRSGATAALHE